ncbi:MAG: N-6 DNA methylase [Bacteroidales bacterium]|nr:N-6 DNA methylase [Bacteroidales bacterium]
MELELDFGLNKTDKLLRKFEEIHNFIYANDGLSTQQTLEEFIKILFVKILDERENVKLFKISLEEFELLKDSKTNCSFLSRIDNLFSKTKSEYPDLFDKDEKIRLSETSLSFIVNKLQNISLTDSSSDVKGLAFQKFLSHQEKDGRGQFFTPEPIIDFCVKIIQPHKHETIIDPACGSGGFLFSALEYIKKNNKDCNIDDIIQTNIFGLDINKSIARIAKMKLILEANVLTNIHNTNSLNDIDELKLKFINNNIVKGFDIVLTNPPFGTAGKITNKAILSKFELGYKWLKENLDYTKTNKLQNSQTAEILFIERSIDLLKEGGRMGIVLPNGHFENPSLEYLRYYIKKRCKILAIVNLPQETFIPYGTGVKTSLLFLEKNSENTNIEYKVFFSKITKLGYQGNKNGSPIYKKDKYGNIKKNSYNQPILDENFTATIEDFSNYKNQKDIENENSYLLSYDELNGRFDYDFYSPETKQLLNKINNNNAKKLSDIVDIIKVKSKLLSNPNAKVEYVELSDVNTPSFEIINSTEYFVHELPSRASYEIKAGDIITAIAGNSIGSRKHATALVSDAYDGSICTNGFRVFRNFKIDPYYLLFYFKTEFFLKQIYILRTGAAIPNVSDFDLGNILISLPDEQIIKAIGEKVRKSFELREKSKMELENIKLELT